MSRNRTVDDIKEILEMVDENVLVMLAFEFRAVKREEMISRIIDTGCSAQEILDQLKSWGITLYSD